MGTILDRAERSWRGEVDPREHWRPTGDTEEVAAGVVFLNAFANVTVVRTTAGLVLVDSSNYQARPSGSSTSCRRRSPG